MIANIKTNHENVLYAVNFRLNIERNIEINKTALETTSVGSFRLYFLTVILYVYTMYMMSNIVVSTEYAGV